MEFKAADYNPWGKGNRNGDCVVRAICATTRWGYLTVCKMLGVEDKCRPGFGYDGGITHEQLVKFAKETGILELVWEDDMYAAWEKGDSGDFAPEYYTAEDSLEFFADNYMDAIKQDMKKSSPRFLVEVHSNAAKKPGDEMKLHMTTLFELQGGKWLNVDIRECRNVANSVPHRIYAVRKFCKPDSPRYWPTERNSVLKATKDEFAAEMNAAERKNGSKDDK